MNKVFISGNLTADIKEVSSDNFATFLSLSIANNVVYYDKSDNKKEQTTFIDCTLSKKSNFEYAIAKGKKGNFCTISGQLSERSWEKEGTKFKKHYIVIDTIRLESSSQ